MEDRKEARETAKRTGTATPEPQLAPTLTQVNTELGAPLYLRAIPLPKEQIEGSGEPLDSLVLDSRDNPSQAAKAWARSRVCLRLQWRGEHEDEEPEVPDDCNLQTCGLTDRA
jgi:hypothetical protein